MVLGRLNQRYKPLINIFTFLKPMFTFVCTGTTESLKINRIYVTKIAKGSSLIDKTIQLCIYNNSCML